MSKKKVRRWDTDKGSADHTMWQAPDGRYIEYADVARLVEALRNLLSVDDATNAFDAIAAKNDARNELARWQS